jgi:hypothetical protein
MRRKSWDFWHERQLATELRPGPEAVEVIFTVPFFKQGVRRYIRYSTRHHT